MNNSDFTVTFYVEQSPAKAFEAINNVRAWWIDVITGSSEKLNDEFSVQFWDVHYSKQKLVEFVPDKKVVWLVTESKLNFLKDPKEWIGTRIIFEIFLEDGKTAVIFTHQGLVPKIECYKDCSNAWSDYIKKSLYKLITTGKGEPTIMSTVTQ